jgi:uncharacterized protein YqfA (UPF0365 family)
VEVVVRAMIAADRAGLNLDYKLATGIDPRRPATCSGAVQLSVNPKIIDCPDAARARPRSRRWRRTASSCRRGTASRCAPTSRRLVGGATEATIIARVGEGIVTTIGASESYKDVLERPSASRRPCSSKGLDAGTVVRDHVDRHRRDRRRQEHRRQAVRPIRPSRQAVAQARAEVRRAMAVAHSQEMQAKIMENRAKLVLANAEIPRAIADAFRRGPSHGRPTGRRAGQAEPVTARARFSAEER